MFQFKLLYVYCSFFILTCLLCKSASQQCKSACRKNDPAVKKLQEYLRIDTSGGKNMDEVVTFFERQAADLGLPFSVHYPDGLPVCVISWIGANTSLPSIVLNSHADVVPVEDKFWTHEPFSADIDKDCNIYGRGAQDTKGLTIQYIEAIRKLMQSNVTLQRTLHVTVMPDEETGGYRGIKPFVKTKEFDELNVGFVLDEGLNLIPNVFYVSYHDKRPWQMKFTIFGEAGHGSGMPSTSAVEKMYKLLTIVMKFREEQNEIREQKEVTDYGAYTSVNINIVNCGVATNVIPSEVTVVIDMRLAVDADIADIEAMVESWRLEAGNSTTLEFLRRDTFSSATSLECNPYWKAMEQTAKDIGINLKPIILPATSDMVPLRNMGIPALGFAPRDRTPSLIHGNDEYINIDVLLEGVDIYLPLLKSLGNLPDFSQST